MTPMRTTNRSRPRVIRWAPRERVLLGRVDARRRIALAVVEKRAGPTLGTLPREARAEKPIRGSHLQLMAEAQALAAAQALPMKRAQGKAAAQASPRSLVTICRKASRNAHGPTVLPCTPRAIPTRPMSPFKSGTRSVRKMTPRVARALRTCSST